MRLTVRLCLIDVQSALCCSAAACWFAQLRKPRARLRSPDSCHLQSQMQPEHDAEGSSDASDVAYGVQKVLPDEPDEDSEFELEDDSEAWSYLRDVR